MTDKSDSPDLFADDAFEGVMKVSITTEAFTAEAIQMYEFPQDVIYEVTMSDPEDRAILLREMFEQALVDPQKVPVMASLSSMDMTEVITEWRNLSAEAANIAVQARIKARREAGLASTTFGLLD